MKCKQMTKGMRAILQNKCLFCWVGELESCYRQWKFEKIAKKELQAERRKLNEKFKNFGNEHYETVSSFSDENQFFRKTFKISQELFARASVYLHIPH